MSRDGISLERYLQDVTVPFPSDTARRIRLDLEEHALAHADALRDAGHPDPEAAALASLGPAREVRQALERAHYTRAEEESLLRLGAFRRATKREPVWHVVAGVLVGLVLPVWLLAHAGSYVLESWLMAALWLTVHWGLMFLGGRVRRRFSPRSAGVLRAWLSDLFWPLAGLLMLLPGAFIHGVGYLPWPFTIFLLVTAAVFSCHAAVWTCLPKALRNAR